MLRGEVIGVPPPDLFGAAHEVAVRAIKDAMQTDWAWPCSAKFAWNA